MPSKRRRREDNEDVYEEEDEEGTTSEEEEDEEYEEEDSPLDEEEDEGEDEEDDDEDDDDDDEGEEDGDEDDEEEDEEDDDGDDEDDDGDDDDDDDDDDEDDEDEEDGEEEGEEEEDDGEGEDVEGEDDGLVYFVQEVMTDGDGIERQPGDAIPIKCKNCALWKREWAGEVHCDVGNVVNDEECHPERFSCGSYFWPLERAHLLKEFLAMDADEVLTVNRMRIGLRRMLGAPAGSKGGNISHLDWIADWMEKHGREDKDPRVPYETALNFVHKFRHFDEVDFPYEFFNVYAAKVKANEDKHKKRAGRPRGFRRGDFVEWTNLSDGARVSGLLMRVGGRDFKGQVLVACTTPDHELLGAQCSFVITEWEKKCSPMIKVKATSPQKMM